LKNKKRERERERERENRDERLAEARLGYRRWIKMDASVLWMSRGSRGDLLSTFMDVAATTLALQVFSLVKQVRERAVNAGVQSAL